MQASQFGFLHFVDVAQIENTTLQQFVAPNYFLLPTRIDTLSPDFLTKCKIQHLLGDPYYVFDNGSCLFNAVSVALCGTEDLAVELPSSVLYRNGDS